MKYETSLHSLLNPHPLCLPRAAHVPSELIVTAHVFLAYFAFFFLAPTTRTHHEECPVYGNNFHLHRPRTGSRGSVFHRWRCFFSFLFSRQRPSHPTRMPATNNLSLQIASTCSPKSHNLNFPLRGSCIHTYVVYVRRR